MSESQTADDSTELKFKDDVSNIAQIEAERVADVVDCDVIVYETRGSSSDTEIVVHWESEFDVNGYSKASTIEKVLSSDASVSLHSTKEGKHALSFTPNE